LIDLGLTRHGIAHRLAIGRLHRIARGIYAVGRPELTREGRWMAAVLATGPGSAYRTEAPEAMLSHGSAAALWRIGVEKLDLIEVSTRASSPRSRPGVRVHRRPSLRPDAAVVRNGIPVTSPVQTLVDLATRLDGRPLERAINEADKLDLVDPEALRAALEGRRDAGAPRLRRVLDRATFVYTRTELERAFLPLARDAGLPAPLTAQWVNGYEVDFHWPALRLVVETDGLRYHRTPAEQAEDRRRDQAHTAAGLTQLRFTHGQVKYEKDHMRRILRVTGARLLRRVAAQPAPVVADAAAGRGPRGRNA
jgi:very-short-patch-repair endonuclease